MMKQRSAGCACSYLTDEWNGWGCEVTDGACVFLRPNSKACAEIYGEGPDAWPEDGDAEEETDEHID